MGCYLIEEILGIYHEPGSSLITLVLNEATIEFIALAPGYVHT